MMAYYIGKLDDGCVAVETDDKEFVKVLCESGDIREVGKKTYLEFKAAMDRKYDAKAEAKQVRNMRKNAKKRSSRHA